MFKFEPYPLKFLLEEVDSMGVKLLTTSGPLGGDTPTLVLVSLLLLLLALLLQELVLPLLDNWGIPPFRFTRVTGLML